jgi:carbamoyltransferase
LSKNNVIVLGIHYGHDSGAAIVQNGKVLAAINEERIRNIKHYAGIPSKSISEVIKISKIDPSQIDLISIVGILDVEKKPNQIDTIYADLYFTWNPITVHKQGANCFIAYNERFRKLTELKKELSQLGISSKQILFVDHHMAHAASAYYLSPWDISEEVLIFTADAAGDGLSSTVNFGKKGKIERLENSENLYYDSLGYCFYDEITYFLGMRPNDHAYKVMGLAPYGESNKCIDKIKTIIDIDKQNNLKFKNKLNNFQPFIHEQLKDLLDHQRFDHVAASAQTWFEHLVTNWIKNGIEKTGIHKIVCAGGNFLNVKANKKILEIDDVHDSFFCPAAGDEGLAVGSALMGYFELSYIDGNTPTKSPLKDAYLGSSFSNDSIKDVIRKNDLSAKTEFYDNIDEEVGELLTNSELVIARFSDRMEWGPRGLGNRSILANPSNHKIIRKINNAIKMRDFWMPFGPSILSSRMDDYLENPRPAHYMIEAFNTTTNRDDLIAAIHPYDFTCRPQTVFEEYNPKYHKLLATFESKTGIGGILNTSFNLHGFPIVFDPQTAIETFKNSKLDILALGNYLIKK